MRGQSGLACAFSACVIVVGLVTTGAAAAEAEALICETDQSFDCAPGSTCVEDNAEAVGLPSILRVDLGSDQIVGTMPDGTDLQADFAGEVQKDGRLVMTGIQAGLGWTMTVAQGTGAMTLAISGDSIGFLVFGSCVPD
jgi:hypothetical protein